MINMMSLLPPRGCAYGYDSAGEMRANGRARASKTASPQKMQPVARENWSTP